MELIEPWVIVVGLALLIPIFGVVFGTVTQYLTAKHQAELDASLKHEMLERGMSAEEIKTVIEAKATGRKKASHSHAFDSAWSQRK